MSETKVSELPAVESLEADALLLITQGGKSQSATIEQLMLLAPKMKLKGSLTSGNWSSNYPDNPSSDNAAGKLGNASYWKTEATLYSAPVGTQTALAKLELQKSTGIPCDADGNPLPYQLLVGDMRYSQTAVPQVDIWLIVFGTPTQTMDLIRKNMRPLGLVDDVQYDPHYVLNYWWVE